MEFRYHKLLLDYPSPFFGHSILKPIIPIRIAVGGDEVEYAALIDSGADFSIFDAEIGEYLRLDVKNGTRIEFGGIQEKGGAEAFLHQVTLNVGGRNYKTMAGFSYDIARQGFGILGQK